MRRTAIRSFKSYLSDMQEAMSNIIQYTEGLSLHEFHQGGMIKDAVLYNFQVLGEGVKHIPRHIQNKNKQIPWMYMAALRNDIVHEYFDPDDEIVWNIIHLDLPQNLIDLKRLMNQLENENH
jgi:uncharacterized protein with HEPN domain